MSTIAASLISRYVPKSPDQIDVQSRMLKFIASTPRALFRDNLEGHLTGSALLINSAGTHTLLTHHKKLNKWMQLGGHADGEEELLNVALREAREESGIIAITPYSPIPIDLDIHQIPETPKTPAHLHYDVRFLLQVDAPPFDNFTVSDESHELRWCTPEEVRKVSQEASLIRLIHKWASLRKS